MLSVKSPHTRDVGGNEQEELDKTEYNGEVMASGSPLLLMHLSDLHFQKDTVGHELDRDNDIRNELKADATALCKRLGQNVDAILITGDIAFGGKTEEYEFAKRWLEDLCGCVGCEMENVFTVPGNHDVDRSVIAASPVVHHVQDGIRNANKNKHDDELADVLKDTRGNL